MYEAFHIANLFYLMNESTLDETKQTSSGNSDNFSPEYYVLSTRWFEKWKSYVNFDNYMQNTEKFLRLNKENVLGSGNNFLLELDLPIKSAVENYFQNYFLTDNSQLYPGSVSNKELLYDKGVYYMDLNEKKLFTNYNIIDYYQMGRDYFIVNKPIWNYFRSIYGGKEIKRYLHEKSSHNDSSLTLSEEYFVETKLKNISICIVRFKKDEIKFKERPKFVFFPHRKSVYDFKKHLLKIFSFLKDSLMRDIRLWLLDTNYSFESFQEYFVNNYKNNTHANKYGENINFPGICLDLLDSNLRIEEIDDLISNRIIVLEYIDNLNFKNFMFRRQYWSDLPTSMKESFKADKIFEGEDGNNRVTKKRSELIFDPSANGAYDSILVNKNDGDDQDRNDLSVLFEIKKFFLMKYGLVNFDCVKNGEDENKDERFEDLARKIYEGKSHFKGNGQANPVFLFNKSNLSDDDSLNRKIDEEFLIEINYLRENLHLIMYKNEVMQKFSYSYFNSDKFLINASNYEKESRRDSSENLVKSRQELIMKKRERARLTSTRVSQKYTIASNEIPETNEENISIINYNLNEENKILFDSHTRDLQTENNENITDQEITIEISNKDESSPIKSGEKCSYCDKPFEEIDYITCETCNQSNYCNNLCKSKDNRFHSKLCK